jgi:hypothetical protein
MATKVQCGLIAEDDGDPRQGTAVAQKLLGHGAIVLAALLARYR